MIDITIHAIVSQQGRRVVISFDVMGDIIPAQDRAGTTESVAEPAAVDNAVTAASVVFALRQ